MIPSTKAGPPMLFIHSARSAFWVAIVVRSWPISRNEQSVVISKKK